MQFDTKTKGDHVNIAIRDPGLPADEETRESLLHELELAVAVVLDEYGLDDDSINVVGGHTYAAINADCPQCGGSVEMIEPTLDHSNGAFASASCECGWHGDAIYRLIDFHEVESKQLDDEAVDEQDSTETYFEYIGCLERYNLRPHYTPY